MTPQFNKRYTKEEFFNPEFQDWLRKNMPVGKVKVDNNPHSKGGEAEIYYRIDTDGDFSTHIINQNNIDSINYAFCVFWKDGYTGTFTLINPYQNIKPELYQVDDTVEVLENIKDCEDFYDCLPEKQESVGKTFKVKYVLDGHYEGICYLLDNDCTYPYYCIKKVNSVNSTEKQKQDLIEKIKDLQSQIEELKNQTKTRIEELIKVIESQTEEIKNSIK